MLVPGTLAGDGNRVIMKGNQSDAISMKLLNEVTTNETAGNQSELTLTFIIGHNPAEAVGS